MPRVLQGLGKVKCLITITVVLPLAAREKVHLGAVWGFPLSKSSGHKESEDGQADANVASSIQGISPDGWPMGSRTSPESESTSIEDGHFESSSFDVTLAGPTNVCKRWTISLNHKRR
jgi:hypothetical protein